MVGRSRKAFILSVVCLGILVAARAGGELQGGETPPSPERSIHVYANQSVLLDSPVSIKRVSIARPETADVIVISPMQLLIVGKSAGTTTLVYWSGEEVPTIIEVVVDLNLDKVRADLSNIAPDETFELTASGDSMILTGTVATRRVKDRLVEAAKVYSKNVVDLLKVVKLEQVLLQIRVAEINRTLAKELGMTLFLQGIINGQLYRGFLNPPGSFNSFSGTLRDPIGPDATFGDLTNIFVSKTTGNSQFAGLIRVLEDKGALKVLSEPNLVVASGDEGNFLVGGEFPVVIASAAGSGAAASVEYKEYGISLNFKPLIVPNGDIYIKISQEVSELDFANGVAISGFQLPGLKTRKAESGLQLGDGQTFVLAGLLENKITRKVTKIPILGDIPFLGVLFRNARYNNEEIELMVMVTPKIVRPLNKEEIPALPTEIMKEKETSPNLVE
ncbi:MAG: pilus assembly protein N-terminal domain-containing protein [Candidatus Deferrimicrobiaceae bacterium]